MFTEQLTHLLNETFIKVIWQMRIWLSAKILRQRNCFIPTCCNHVELCKFHTRVFGSHYTRRIWREDSNIITNIGMHSLWIMPRVSVVVFAIIIWEQVRRLTLVFKQRIWFLCFRCRCRCRCRLYHSHYKPFQKRWFSDYLRFLLSATKNCALVGR